jgi:hypothetical protein
MQVDEKGKEARTVWSLNTDKPITCEYEISATATNAYIAKRVVRLAKLQIGPLSHVLLELSTARPRGRPGRLQWVRLFLVACCPHRLTIYTATTHSQEPDISSDEKTEYPNAMHDQVLLRSDYEGKPTTEELLTLRRVPGPMPITAYLICAVEFAERASFYGIKQLISNYVNRPMPKGGNGYGAPPRGTQLTGGALGLGTVKANAIGQSFSMLVYMLPIFFGWMADTKTGRFKQICWGVGVFGVAHVIILAAAAKPLLADGSAKIPFFIGLYILAVGACTYNILKLTVAATKEHQLCSSQTSPSFFSIR